MAPYYEFHRIVFFASYPAGYMSSDFIKKTFLLLLFVTMLGYAQVARTALTGTVTDQQGGRVPLARVKITDIGTGLHRETQTSSQGIYAIANLPAGTFQI